MHRIAVIGSSGAGKSTLARRRRIIYGATARPDMGEGCPESLLEQIRSSKRVIHLRSPRQVAVFLREVSPNHSEHSCD